MDLRSTSRSRLAMTLCCVVMLCALCGAACSDGQGKAPKTPTRPLPGSWHRVVANDTVETIAKRYKARLQDIEEINGVDRRDKLRVGRLLFVPRAPGAKVAAKTASSQPAAKSDKLRWPVAGGTLTSTFGRRGKRAHEGIDIGAKEGTPVLAAAAGTVIYSGSGIKGYGNLVIVRHKGGLVTVYAHNKRNLARDGQQVRAGETIAEVGSSGRSTGPHLHFEVRIGDKPVDPLGHVELP
jgi:murein DD-endopeptidase MepM/ murein hydrolase activator NlpD